MLNKITFTLLTVCAVFSALPLSAAPNDAVSGERPNVIFILVDDMGWGDLGVFHQNDSKHSRKHKTPLLDQMANDGMQLRAHYCPAPVCAPSRASLFTGVHQGHASVRNNQFDKALIDNHTIATVMKAAGYKTALIGKYGLQGKGSNPKSWEAYPTKRGFDEFFGYVRHVDGHLHYPADKWPLGNNEVHQTEKEVWWNDSEVSNQLQTCYTTDLFTARSKKWIEEHQKTNASQPFFLCLTYDTPHAALQVPSVPYPKGLGLNGGLQWTGEKGKMINTAEGTIDSFRHPDYVDKGWSDVEERFATMVRRIDNAVGDLLQTLKDLGIEENTMVVFTSDNGPHHESYINQVEYNADAFQSYGPYDGTKRDTWEGGIRMPSLVWWPGKIGAGSINESPSQFHDWMPTFADMANVAAPARTDGVSLLPTLTGTGEQAQGTVYIEYAQGQKTKSYAGFKEGRGGKKRGEMQVIMLDGYKGVRTNIKKHVDPFEIYDVSKDPGERNDLANSNARFVELGEKMKDQVLRLRTINKSAKRCYDYQPIPSYEEAGSTVGFDDFAYSTFEGDFQYVPKVDAMKATSNGKCTLENIPSVKGAVELETWIEVSKTGMYEFTFSSQAPAFVRVHDAELFDADFHHQSTNPYKKTIKLEMGFHPIGIVALTSSAGKIDIEVDFVQVEN